ncbi:unnamed protein product [Phaeothamnion confervicola]
MNGLANSTNNGDFPNYDDELEKCRDFLQNFRLFDGDNLKYMDILQEIADRERTDLNIELDDIMVYRPDGELAAAIANNTVRYIKLFCRATDRLLEDVAPLVDLSAQEDVFDVLRAQRVQQQGQAGADAAADPDGDPVAAAAAAGDVPAALMRRYELRIVPCAEEGAPMALRAVRASDIGRLVRIRAMVTRVSDVKPLVTVVAFTCDKCGCEAYQEVFGRQFTPVQVCPSRLCREHKSTGKLFMQTRGSRFMRYQELRIQELPDQVPIGHIPRTMTVHCQGSLTRECTPGDVVTVSGIFLPMRFEGYKALKAGLISDTYLEAQHIFRHRKGYSEFVMTSEMELRIDEVARAPDPLGRLARSIAPEIYGHEDVKRALLLQLVGGVTRRLPDGMRIRGDINMCLMGDPGVAKSQLLKYIASVAPRGVYTTGKGSSGVGLTAAVIRDPVTGEMALEGGALVLADMGVCCIDEFDKMDEASFSDCRSDRTAIHEVMEQQTVSIAKAGITTTLNARAAVLAAANPLFGRYNRRRTMAENINLPNSLLSRFDLLFLVLDRSDAAADMALARHVTYVHMHMRNPDLQFVPLEPLFMKHYISLARTIEPYVPPELVSYIVEAYVTLRLQASDAEKPSDQTAMTARQLLSILRLSQALARLKFCETVTSADVDEAIRLTHISKASLADDDEVQQGNFQASYYSADVTSRIFTTIRDFAAGQRRADVEYAQVLAMVVNMGLKPQQLDACLAEYADLNVLAVNAERTRITLTDGGGR